MVCVASSKDLEYKEASTLSSLIITVSLLDFELQFSLKNNEGTTPGVSLG